MEVSLLDKWNLEDAIVADPELSTAAKLVAVRLLHHHNNKTGQCNPSYRVLASGTSLSVRAVISGAAQLEAGRWMTIDRTVGGKLGKGPDSNRFHFDFGRAAPSTRAEFSLPPVQKTTPLPCRICTGGVQQTAPPPVQILHPNT